MRILLRSFPNWQSPLNFVVLLLLSAGLFFSGFENWWQFQIILQIGIGLTGLFIKPWRVISSIFLTALVLLNIQWFYTFNDIPSACAEYPPRVTGQVTDNSFHQPLTFKLIKVSLQCGGVKVRFPAATVSPLKYTEKTRLWFQVGDHIELSQLDVSMSDSGILKITPQERFRTFNLNRKNRILQRTPLLIYIQNKARYYLGDFSSAVYQGLLTADRSKIQRGWMERIKKLGIAHLFAISGMHIGIIFLWLVGFSRILLASSGRWVEKAYLIAAVELVSIGIIYLFLTTIGMPVSALRALIMIAWWVVMRHFVPWQPLWFVLAGTAVMIFLVDPLSIGQLSFQLSFVAVFAILWILPLLPKGRYNDSGVTRFYRLLGSSFLISAWLFFVSLPLVVNLSPVHSPVSIVINVIHILYMTFVFLPVLLLTLFFVILGYPFGGFPGEFYAYGVINVLGKAWEQLMIWSESGIDHFMWSLNWEFSGGTTFAYWALLVLISGGVKWKMGKGLL